MLLRRLCASRVRLTLRSVLQHRTSGLGPRAAVPNARPRHGHAEPSARDEVAQAPRRGQRRRLEPAAVGHVQVQGPRQRPRHADAQGAAPAVGPRRHEILCNPPDTCDSPLHGRCSAAALAPACCASETSPQGTVLRIPPDPITRPVHTVLRVRPGCPPRSPRHSTQSVPCEYSEYPQQPEPTITKDATVHSIARLCTKPATSRPSQPARAGQCRV